jgi:hypothetical protein
MTAVSVRLLRMAQIVRPLLDPAAVALILNLFAEALT